ncbi:MAG: hypothetical protein PHP53_10005 [Prolixibacteraceae bacterium]|nr:hypothetical protein [Prolixibacteraceae bacterium]
MKKILILFLFGMFATSTQAQTFAEWFRQKKTQKQYLIQQIAALQVYIGYAQKGYSIAQEGLNMIGDFKRGEFNLHTGYFNSLKNVNPKIKQYAKVADIMAMQVAIIKGYNRTRRQMQESGAFNGKELDYIIRVLGRLLDDCENTLDELITVTTDGNLEMKDDERLERIDILYQDMTDKYTFSQSFSNETMVLAASRIKENNDVQTSRALYGIKHD